MPLQLWFANCFIQWIFQKTNHPFKLPTPPNVFALLEYIVSGHPRLATNLFNALMNSSLVWSGNNSKCIALFKLPVKRRMYDFFSIFFLAWCMIGPAKSVLMTWNSLDPVVLSIGNWPCGGVAKGFTWYRLHSNQFLIILLVNCCNFVIQ